MNQSVIIGLIKETMTDPRSAATRAIGFGIPVRSLWMMVVLIGIIAALFSSALLYGMKIPDPILAQIMQETVAYKAPMIFAFLDVLQTAFGMMALFYIGRLLGGVGRVEDVLSAMLVVQVTGIVLFVGITLLGLVAPTVASMGLLAVFGWSIWATLSAIDVAHRFDNMLTAFFVALLAFVAMFLVSAIVMSVLLPAPQTGGL